MFRKSRASSGWQASRAAAFGTALERLPASRVLDGSASKRKDTNMNSRIVGLPVEVLVAAHQIITLVVGLPIAGGLSIWMWRLSCTPTRRSEITPRPMKVRLGRRPAAGRLRQLA